VHKIASSTHRQSPETQKGSGHGHFVLSPQSGWDPVHAASGLAAALPSAEPPSGSLVHKIAAETHIHSPEMHMASGHGHFVLSPQIGGKPLQTEAASPGVVLPSGAPKLDGPWPVPHAHIESEAIAHKIKRCMPGVIAGPVPRLRGARSRQKRDPPCAIVRRGGIGFAAEGTDGRASQAQVPHGPLTSP
jgi:hypothetical protein